MHYLQRNIIKELAFEGSMTFTDLKPDTVTNSQFGYHLKQLIKDDFIKKNNDKYQLTARGKRYIDRLSFVNFSPRMQPKSVNILYATNTDGELLLYERKHEPYKGMIALPSGKTHIGEHFVESAKRELMEKSGLKSELQMRGLANIQINNKAEIVSHIYGFVFVGTTKKAELVNSHPKGKTFWGKIQNQNNVMPGTSELIQKIENSKDFFVFDKQFEV